MNTVIQTRVPAIFKKQAEALFASMGLNLPDAIRMFLQQSLNEGALPFQPRAKTPNAETIAAMEELDRGGGKRYASLEEWRKNLWEDED
jgi:DNA-damage-inducible protein J